uniref:Uncharacterized protein n=1 Tax=Arundo donax TaxID=35708 RepID=A0A0A9AGX0_ARUDO
MVVANCQSKGQSTLLREKNSQSRQAKITSG